MLYSRRTLGAIMLCVLTQATVTSMAKAETIHWHYTGNITTIFDNLIDAPISIGEPVRFDISFDPLTPDVNGLSGVGDYLMSGDAASIRMTIGGHTSDPVKMYRITVIEQGCCAANDQFNFLSFPSQGSLIEINFPGFIGDAELALFFRRRIDPITNDELPLNQPDPADFYDVRFGIRKGPSSARVLSFNGSLDALPEPSGFTLTALTTLGLFMRRRA